MAKFIENKSRGVISMGAKNFIPGAASVEITEDEAAHPMIAAYVAAGKLTLTEEAAVPSIDSMTLAQLKSYAEGNGIDLTGIANTKAAAIAAIKAAEAGA